MFKSWAYEGGFNLINVFCRYETKSVLVYTELSIIRIGEAGFEQFSNVVVPLMQYSLEKCILSATGEMLFKMLLIAKTRDKYALFLPKFSAHPIKLYKSKTFVFLSVAIMTRDVCG